MPVALDGAVSGRYEVSILWVDSENAPFGLPGDPKIEGLVFALVLQRCGPIACGMQSIGIRILAVLSCAAHGEFRRLTGLHAVHVPTISRAVARHEVWV